METAKVIIDDLGDELFDILVDESRDVSDNEQIVVVIRYVKRYGSIVERFLGIVHVTTTTTISLNIVIDDLFCKHSFTTSRIRGQDYDGANNMQGQFSGLKSLILRESSYAFYVPYFAHK